MTRDYAYEALAEVTSTDWNVGRGELNAALRDIRNQEPDVLDSFLLSVEIHERAKMYRVVFPNAALTPTALSKHWQRVRAETSKTPKVGPPPKLPPRSVQGLQEVKKLMSTLWPEGETHAR